MPSGLHGEESGIQAQPDKHEKDVLLMGQDWARCGLGKIRHNETEYRQGNDHPKIGVGALEIVLLLAMAPATDQQRQADHAVEDDHRHGKHCVSGQGWIVGSM